MGYETCCPLAGVIHAVITYTHFKYAVTCSPKISIYFLFSSSELSLQLSEHQQTSLIYFPAVKSSSWKTTPKANSLFNTFRYCVIALLFSLKDISVHPLWNNMLLICMTCFVNSLCERTTYSAHRSNACTILKCAVWKLKLKMFWAKGLFERWLNILTFSICMFFVAVVFDIICVHQSFQQYFAKHTMQQAFYHVNHFLLYF